MNHRRLFFELLFPHGVIELRAIRAGRVVGRRFGGDIDGFCADHADAELYFGVAPRDAKTHRPLAPTALWVDVDFKDTPEADARERLMLMDEEPHVVVRSGGGLHCYWILKSPVADAKGALRALAREAGGDPRSAEPAHILRIPDTQNHKYDPPRGVAIERIRAGAWAFDLALGSEDQDAPRASYAGSTGGEAAYAAAVAWLADRAPAVEGSGGDDWTFQTCCHLTRDLGLSEELAMRALASWNWTCSPPWDERELLDKVRGSVKYGRGEVGAADPVRDFVSVADATQSPVAEKPESAMQLLDRLFKVVDDNGRLRVYTQRRDETLGRMRWVTYSKQDFVDVVRSQLHVPDVAVGSTAKGGVKYAPAGVAFLDHYRKKTTYDGVAFMPECAAERTPGGMLNLWRGFAVEESPAGSWEIMKEMIWETLCAEDGASYDYVMDWLARAVQVPWEPGGTALVFKGTKGTGKSTLGRTFARLFGAHGMHVSSKELLTGRFNQHLRDCAALFADEAFWAGDKNGEGVLKALLTERMLAYEGKGRDPESGRNCLHIVMASNEDWVVPAGMDGERRFAVFEVADLRRDKTYWDALHDEFSMARMLWELRRRDVSAFSAFAVPNTTALAEQKIQTMGAVASWLYEAAASNWEDFGEARDGAYLTSDVYASYLRACDKRGMRGHRLSKVSFGMALKKYAPNLRKKRVLMPGQVAQQYFYDLSSSSSSEEVIRHINKMVGLSWLGSNAFET